MTIIVNIAVASVFFIFGSVLGVTVGWLCGCGYGFVYGLWHSKKLTNKGKE